MRGHVWTLSCGSCPRGCTEGAELLRCPQVAAGTRHHACPLELASSASGVEEGRLGLEAPKEGPKGVTSLSPLSRVAACGGLFAWPCLGFKLRRPTYFEEQPRTQPCPGKLPWWPRPPSLAGHSMFKDFIFK